MEVSYEILGHGAAASGTLRDSLLQQEADRIAITELEKLKNENRLLRESVNELRRSIEQYEALDVAMPGLKTIAAGVIAYDPGKGRRGITIAAGSKHGLSGGEIVTAGGAVAGQVKELGAHYSRVRLLTDPGSILPVRSTRTRQVYLLRGRDGKYCSLEMAERHHDIAEKDILVTTRFPEYYTDSQVLPPGIPVARVISVGRDEKRPLFQYAEAVPLVQLERLEHVLVLKK